MGRKKSVPDSASAALDYDLAVIFATYVEQSDEYESRADFVRAALWEKLRDDVGTTDVLDHYIQTQKKRVEKLEAEKRRVDREFEAEKDRLQDLQRERDETAEEEAEEFFDQLSEADPVHDS